MEKKESKYGMMLVEQKDFVAEQLRKREQELYKEICSYAKTCFGENNTLVYLIEEKRKVEKFLFHYDGEKTKEN
jgi:hypothetical protein